MVISGKITTDPKAKANLSNLGRELVGWYRVLPNTVVDQINQLLEDKIRRDSLDGVGADGAGFRSLEDTYAISKNKQVGTSEANLHYGYRRGRRAFDRFYMQRDGAKNSSSANFQDGIEYMIAHQTGTGRRPQGGTLPQRKFFPETEDFQGTHYERFNDQVRDILIDYLDSLIQRTLNG